jgi:FdhD protein
MKNLQVELINIQSVRAHEVMSLQDSIAVEEPLEISMAYSTSTGRIQKNIAVTMRTPGDDEELAAGFLFTEGIIPGTASIDNIIHQSSDENRVLVTLLENIMPDLSNASRNFYTTSSCGICGKASIDAIITASMFNSAKDDILINAPVLYHLQDHLEEKQLIFADTGGIHASALFDLQANLLSLREDVGRHNALDKLIGAALLAGRLPLSGHILFLSGRTSFELVQKAVKAGIRVIAAVGAPSSLAVETAREARITLVGFLRNNRFNIYSGSERISM